MPRVAASDKRRGPYAKSAQRQAEILDQAERSFAERGFAGASLREIALAVGMTQQGMAHHFRTKEALLEAVLRRRDASTLARYGSVDLTVTEVLRGVVQDNVEQRAVVRLETTLAAEGVEPQHPAHGYVTERFGRARNVFTALLRRGQSRGEVRDDVPAEVLATLLVSLLEGLQLQWLVDGTVDMPRSLEGVLTLLAPTGVEPPPP